MIAICFLLLRTDPYDDYYFFQDLASFCRMYCSFVIANCYKEEVCSAHRLIPNVSNYVMQALEGGVFGMWMPMIDR